MCPRGSAKATVTRRDALLLTVEETRRLLKISRGLAYDLIARGDLPSIRLGRVIRVPCFGLEQWIAERAGIPPPSAKVVSWPPQRH